MPHLLIAGSTGSGKSVAINAFIMSLLYKATPEEVRLILVDPKRLELGNYEGVPHLHTPIITEPKLASNALRNAVREMERRLKVLAEKGVRNIDQYNKLFDSGTPSLFEEGSDAKPLPFIVIIIDELADLMMLDGRTWKRRSRAWRRWPARRNSSCAGDAKAVGRRDHWVDQGKFPGAYVVPRGNQDRFAHHSRRQWRRGTAGARRYVVSPEWIGARAPRTRSVCDRRERSLRSSSSGRRKARRSTRRPSCRRRAKMVTSAGRALKATARAIRTSCSRMQSASCWNMGKPPLPCCSAACASVTAVPLI